MSIQSRFPRALGIAVVALFSLACSAAGVAAATEASAVQEPSPVATDPGEPLRWGASLHLHIYRESLMRLVGPALGLRAETAIAAAGRPVTLEGELSVGLVDYSSPVSGELNGAKRIGSMLHASSAVLSDHWWLPRPGVAFTTEWTDLRGVSSTGSGDTLRLFNGYERFNASLWLTGSWDLDRDRIDGAIRARAGLLLAGWQRSMLSQAVLGYGDVTTRQHRGLLLSVETAFRFDDRLASIRAGLRSVGQSSLARINEVATVYEPANRTFDLAVTIWR